MIFTGLGWVYAGILLDLFGWGMRVEGVRCRVQGVGFKV